MDGDLSPIVSGSEEPLLSAPGADATDGYLQKQTAHITTDADWVYFFQSKKNDYYSPLSKALVVPFSTSSVRAAMMSAC